MSDILSVNIWAKKKRKHRVLAVMAVMAVVVWAGSTVCDGTKSA